MVLCSQLPPHSGNHRDIPHSIPHRYLTHILSHNHCHRMCFCPDVGSQKPLNFTFIHTDSTFQWCYALNFRHTPAITEISRIQVHTGTSHIFCHTTTVIACNHRDIPESSPHRYSTRILSHNHCHRMCTCEDVGSPKPLNFTFVLTDSTFHWVYALKLRHTPAITEISWIQVHTCTSHLFCHTTTVIACVFVRIWTVKNR